MNRQKIYTRSYVSETEEGKVRSWCILSPKSFSAISQTNAPTNFDAAAEALKFFCYEIADFEKKYEIHIGHAELFGVLANKNSRNRHRNWEELDSLLEGFDIVWKDGAKLQTGRKKTPYDEAGILCAMAIKNKITEPLKVDFPEGEY